MTFTLRLEQADGTPAEPPTYRTRNPAPAACRRDKLVILGTKGVESPLGRPNV
jgi:hypothetical protein